MTALTRSALMEKFRAMAARGEPIVGGGAGTGLSAKCEEAGGVDLIVIYNSGRYRMAGRGSLAGLLAYGDANAIVVDMAREVLPVVRRTPVLAGVNGTDPFRRMEVFLDEIKALGFAGVQNFPTVGLIDGTFRVNLEETGMSYGLEVDMIATAHKKDLLTTPYVFNEGEAEAMAKAGADIIVCHLGLTTGGAIGAQTGRKLNECPALIDCMGRRRDQGPARHSHLGAWRSDRRTRRCRLHHEVHQDLPRILRRFIHGALAGRNRADRAGPPIQIHQPTVIIRATPGRAGRKGGMGKCRGS